MSQGFTQAAAAALLALALPLATADTIVEGSVTSWGHPQPESNYVRGVMFDGRYWYVDDADDSSIDGRRTDQTGRIYIYDDTGQLIKRILENPPVRHTFFPTGIATDGAHLWTTDYWGGRIYEYDISTGALVRTMKGPQPNPAEHGLLSVDYKPGDRTLWVTAYNDPKIYQISADTGALLSTIVTIGFGGNNKRAVLDGRGDLWVGGAAIEGNDKLWRYDKQGNLLQKLVGTGQFAIGVNINNRASGYVRDLARTCARGTCVVPFQRMRVLTTGGETRNLSELQVTCRNLTTGASAPAHFGSLAQWNCEDAGFVASPGDLIHIDVEGVSR